MCARTTLKSPDRLTELRELRVTFLGGLKPRYNIAPTTLMLTARLVPCQTSAEKSLRVSVKTQTCICLDHTDSGFKRTLTRPASVAALPGCTPPGTF
jgi:hypothetical protein